MLDNTDLEIIYEQNVDKIYKFFYNKFYDKEIAEDLTSEVFLEFVKATKSKTPENAIKYLYGITHKVFLQALRKKYKEKTTSFESIENFPEYLEDNITSTYDKKIKNVEILIEKLPEKQKVVLHMRLIEKHSLKDIADILSKDMNYVKTTQKRGIKSLKKLLACTP